MVLIAAIGAVALQDFTEAAAVSFLFAISSTLESLANARARNALASLVNVRTENAHVLNENTKEGVVLPASAVMVGMILMVASGETIPCDGEHVFGTANFHGMNHVMNALTSLHCTFNKTVKALSSKVAQQSTSRN